MSVSVKVLVLQSVFLPKVAQLCVLFSKANGTARFGHCFSAVAESVKKGAKSISQKSSENPKWYIVVILVMEIFFVFE